MTTEPRMPTRCIVCGQQHLSACLPMTTRVNGLQPLNAPMLAAHSATLNCCRHFKTRLQLSRGTGKALLVAAVLVGAAALIRYLMFALDWLHSDWIALALICLAAASGGGQFTIHLYAIFQSKCLRTSPRVCFQDEQFARDFAKLSDTELR